MNQITNDANLWRWKSKDPLTAPFGAMPRKKTHEYTYRTGTKTSYISAIPDFIKALVYFSAESFLNDSTGTDKTDMLPRADHIAIGTKSSGKGDEIIFVEYREKPGFETDCIMYNPSNGDIKGCRIDPKSMATESFRMVNPVSGGEDGTAVFLAVIVSALTKSSYSSISLSKGLLMDYEAGVSRETIEEIYDTVLKACIEIYDGCCISGDFKLKWPESGTDMTRLKDAEIKAGKCSPEKSKVLFGKFEHLKPVKAEDSLTFDASKYYGSLFTGRKYTEEEKRRIPTLDPNYHITKAFILLCEFIYETKDDPAALRLTQVLLEGIAGSGKSALARSICAVFGIPMEVYTCGDRDTKDTMLWFILPDLSDSDLSELTETEKEALDAFLKEKDSPDGFEETLKLLGLPTYKECKLDPPVALETVTGIYNEEAEVSDVYRSVVDKATSLIRDIVRKVPSSSSGVRYVSVKSAIVRAIEQGHCLLFEEVGNLRDPGALSFMNDVLDKEGTGVINTPYGDIQRHPDFMIIATTNRPEDPGVHVINPAFRSRFQYFATLDNMPPAEVKGIVAKKCGITDPLLLDKIYEVYEKTGEASREIGTNAYLTMRALYPFAMAIKRGRDPEVSFTHFLLNAVTTTADQMEDIKNAVSDCALFIS